MATTSSRDQWARLDLPPGAASQRTTVPYDRATVAPPQRTVSPYAAQAPHRPPTAATQETPVGRRLLGVLLLLVLTGLSLPVHVAAVFFAYIQVESPGDPVTGVLLVGGTCFASFLALLVTGTVAQAAGGFPGRWRARVTFAALSAGLSVAATYLAAVALF